MEGLEGLFANQATLAMMQAMRAADAEINPASKEDVDNVLKWLK
jgi:hypothetical protein